MMHISIPKPCHEDWNAMNPNEQGRHCNVCCKTVVDFTSMNDEEVKYFFVNKKKEDSVCGRFKNEQLQRIKITLPYNIYTLSMPLWKQFLTACLLAFSSMLFSCDAMVGKTHTTGDIVIPGTNTIEYKTTGTPAISIDTTVKSTCTILTGDTVVIQSVENITQGMSIIQPVEPEKEIPLMGEPAIQAPDTSQSILTGKIAYDTSGFINPNAVDTVKGNEKATKCGNDFINL
jgi:hypothetical protein